MSGSAQEGFDDTLTIAGLPVGLISIDPPEITRGKIPSTTLANTGADSHCPSALVTVGDCGFVLDVALCEKAVMDLINSGVSLECVYTVSGVSTLTWYGMFGMIKYDTSNSDLNGRHTGSGSILATNETDAGVKTAPVFADVV